MESSKVGHRDWLLAMFLVTTRLKGVSSMKLHLELGITQKSAWLLAQRLRKALTEDGELFLWPVEVDETYFHGKRRNMPNSKRTELTKRRVVGTTAVAGAKDRATNQVAAKAVADTDADPLQRFVRDNTDPDHTAHTEDATADETLPFDHDTVRCWLQEYLKVDVRSSGIESLWSMPKSTFNKISSKHLDRYVKEFADGYNMRQQAAIDQLRVLRSGMESNRLAYKGLIKLNGYTSGSITTA